MVGSAFFIVISLGYSLCTYIVLRNLFLMAITDHFIPYREMLLGANVIFTTAYTLMQIPCSQLIKRYGVIKCIYYNTIALVGTLFFQIVFPHPYVIFSVRMILAPICAMQITTFMKLTSLSDGLNMEKITNIIFAFALFLIVLISQSYGYFQYSPLFWKGVYGIVSVVSIGYIILFHTYDVSSIENKDVDELLMKTASDVTVEDKRDINYFSKDNLIFIISFSLINIFTYGVIDSGALKQFLKVFVDSYVNVSHVAHSKHMDTIFYTSSIIGLLILEPLKNFIDSKAKKKIFLGICGIIFLMISFSIGTSKYDIIFVPNRIAVFEIMCGFLLIIEQVLLGYVYKCVPKDDITPLTALTNTISMLVASGFQMLITSVVMQRNQYIFIIYLAYFYGVMLVMISYLITQHLSDNKMI